MANFRYVANFRFLTLDVLGLGRGVHSLSAFLVSLVYTTGFLFCHKSTCDLLAIISQLIDLCLSFLCYYLCHGDITFITICLFLIRITQILLVGLL